MGHLKGHPGESRKGAAERERQDLGHVPLLGFASGVLWGSQAKAGLVISNQKEGFGKPHRNLTKGCTRGMPWMVGKSVYHQGHSGSHIRNLNLFVIL